MGGKSQTTKTTQGYTPTGLSQLNDIWGRVQEVASQPYTPFGGQMVAGLTPTQQAGISNVNSAVGTAQPYFDQAANYARTGAAAINPNDVSTYTSPYTQQVINATRANFNENNAQQQQQVVGNAAMQGALGGDRVKVAQAELARQQKLAQDPVIAGLYDKSYQDAMGVLQSNRNAAAQGAYTFGALAPSVQNANLQGAGAQISAGGLEQQTEQQRLNAIYQQYLQAQAFPYQQASFLTSAGLPAISAMGGTGTGSSTQPGPSPLAQIAGLGMTAAGLFTGNPMMAMSGLSGAVGGVGMGGGAASSGGGYASMPSTPAPNGSYWGANPWGGFSPTYSRGGAVDSFASTVHSLRAMLKNGGKVIDARKGSDGVYRPNSGVVEGGPYNTGMDDPYHVAPSMWGPNSPSIMLLPKPRGYDDGGTVDPNQRFAQAWADTQGAIDSGTFDPVGANNSTYALNAPAPVPLPQPRPESPYARADEEPASFAPLPMSAPSQMSAPPSMGPSVMAPSLPAQPSGGGIFNLSPEARQGLISAGLGIMASRSPFALTAIGEGGLQGVKTYGEQKKLSEDRAIRQQQADQAAQRLAQQVEQFAKTHGLQEQQLAETRRQHDIAASRPFKIGSTLYGDTYAIPDGKGGLKVIDSKTGLPANPAVSGVQPGITPTTVANDETAIPATAQAVAGQTRDDDYLKSIEVEDPNLAATIRGIANYDIDPYRSTTVRGNMRTRVLGMVQRYDPSYSATMYGPRAAAIKEFMAGGSNSPAGNITSGNTAIQHLGQLADLSEKIGGTNNAWVLNKPLNWLNEHKKEWENDPTLRQYHSALERYSEEATKFYRGTGGSLTDVERSIGNLSAGQSPAARAAAVAQEAELMQSKVSALQDRWKTALGGVGGWQSALKRAGVEDFPIIQKKSADALDRIHALHERKGEPVKGEKGKPTKADIDYARAHPEVRDKFKAKFGVEP